jgi:hypothetical protein
MASAKNGVTAIWQHQYEKAYRINARGSAARAAARGFSSWWVLLWFVTHGA